MSENAPLWLFTGPEIGERNAAIEQVRAAAARKSGNLDCHSLYVQETPVADAVSLLLNGSLFADARFVVLRNAELIKKKEEIELIASWAGAADQDGGSYLVLVSEEIGVDKKIEALVPKQNKKIFWEMFENRKEQWIVDFFRREGLSVEGDAVSAILELVENNTEALKTACSRFPLFFDKGYRVTEADALAILEHNREESAFSLFDAMASGNFETALGIWNKLSLSKESSPIQLMAGLTYCFRKLSDWHRLAASGQTDDFSLKKAGFSGKRAIDQYRQAARRWNAESTDRVLGLIADTDLAMRSAGSALQGVQTEMFIYAAMRLEGRAPAVAAWD